MSNKRVLLSSAVDLALAHGIIALAFGVIRFALVPAVIEGLGLAGDSIAAASLRRGGAALGILLAYGAFVRFRERRAATELYPRPRAIVGGIITGALMIAPTMLVLFAIGAYQTTWRGWQAALAGDAVVILVAAMLEEVVFRGVLFRQLERALGTTAAIVCTALVFAAVHLPNLGDGSDMRAFATTFVSVAVIGGFWTVLFARTRNLWFVTLHHAAWNFTIVLSGAPLSGLGEWLAAAPLVTVDRGPIWLTGGAFGPENSVLTILIVAAVVFTLARRKLTGSAVEGRPAAAPDSSRTNPAGVVALRESASRLTERWSPRVVAALDDYYVKVCKVHGTFGWHSDDTDELFVVLEGRLAIAMQDARADLGTGDCFVVPRGVLHNPTADEECLLMLIEHAATLRAGSGHAVAVPTRTIAEQLRPL